MTPRLSIIASAIRRVIAAVGSAASAADYYWDKVVLAMKMDTGVDPEWGNTVLAMHMDGGSFVDLKSHTVYVSWSPSATQSKFGGKSASFNGTTDYMTIPTSTDFGFGTGDFTVECWVFTSASGTVLDLRSSSGDLGLFAINGGFISLWNGSTHMQGSITVTTGAWVHLAWVRSAGVVSMFVNGVLDGVSATSATFGTTRPVRIGADIAGANFFNGYIDDLRVSKVARYAVEFTPAAYPFLDGTPVPFLEEKRKAVTVVGNSAINTTTKKYGTGSGYFDGTGDYLTLDGSSDFAFGTEDFTIECWYQASNLNNTHFIYDSRPSGTPNGAYPAIMRDSANNIYYYVNSGYQITSTTTTIVGTWYHIAVVRLNGVTKLYINGAMEGATYTDNTSMIVGSSRPAIGGNGYSPGTNSVFGYIDDLRVTKGAARYTSNFTPDSSAIPTSQKTYLDPYWDKVVLGMHMDGSDNGTTFTEVKGRTVIAFGNTCTKTATKKFGTASTYLDGSGDYLTITDDGSIALSADFTIEGWFNLSATGRQTLIAKGVAGDWQTFNISTDGGNVRALELSMAVGSSWSIDAASSGASKFTVGQWFHLALVRSGTSVVIYVNGTATITQTLSGSPLVNTQAVHIGGGGRYSATMFGYVDDVRITKGVARYTANFQPVQLPFPEKAFDPYPYVSDPHWNSVVLAMHMDGADNGTTFTDVKGHAITVAGNACTKTATKKFGTTSAYFDGTGDFLTVTSTSTESAMGSGDFTIEMWIYVIGTGLQVVLDYRTGSNGAYPALYLNSGALYYYVNTDNNISVPSFPTNQWVHLALCKVSSETRLFLNGVQVGVTFTDTYNYLGNTNTPTIGYGPVTGTYFNGYIDDLRITKGVGRYTTDFTPPGRFPEVLPMPLVDPYFANTVLLMHMDGADNGTTFTDLTGKTVTPTGNACTKTATKKFGTASAYFDGASDYLSVSSSLDFVLPADFTIEFWYSGAVNYSGTIVGNWSSSVFIVQINSDGRFSFTSASVTVYSPVATANVWNHVAVVRTGATVTIYLNGVAGSPGTISPSIGSFAYTLYIASYSVSGSYLTGYIDDLRITKGIARYTENFTPLAAPFPDA